MTTDRASLLKRGVILDLATLHPDDLQLDALLNCLPTADAWQIHQHSTPAECRERLRGMDIAITNKVVLDAATLTAAPDLKLICVAATGTNNVDLAAATARGIAVCNVTGYATPSVVEHVFALILSLQRRLHEQQQAAHEQWQRHNGFCVLDHPTTELAGKTLGILGYGELGRAVAAIGRAFGMRILIGARPGGDARPDRIPLDTLLQHSDILSLHCPLTPDTRNLIGTVQLARMQPTALLINTARGGIVDEAALLNALQHGQLGGAGIDVLIEEPPRHGNALLNAQLPNLIVTPHVAWASREARQRLVDGMVENIAAYRRGERRNRVG